MGAEMGTCERGLGASSGTRAGGFRESLAGLGFSPLSLGWLSLYVVWPPEPIFSSLQRVNFALSQSGGGGGDGDQGFSSYLESLITNPPFSRPPTLVFRGIRGLQLLSLCGLGANSKLPPASLRSLVV